jgi:succinyl-CoA synthetase beta subunit|mmetsp:Transcript_9734/g.13316  ORF Transcript_9734/g.13316 Transcript_9734/m.13316 type:complete len:217 (+) Transcript_9734:16-666(+)
MMFSRHAMMQRSPLMARPSALRTLPLVATPQRFFDLHEFHSKKLMGQFGINVQKGALARSAEEALSVAKSLNNDKGLVVKAQVQAGGRGKGHLTSGMKGGVHVLDSPEEIAEKTKGMIGYNLITHQTTAEGLPVSSVLVHEAVDIDRQIYLAFLHDRKNQGLCCVYSKKGGMDIEAVAEEDPAAIRTLSFPLTEEFPERLAAQIVDDLDLAIETRQ